MARNYYSGVPIGGTIMWAGGLVGLEIPDNFTENYKLSEYTNTRKSSYITSSDLPSSEGFYLRGYDAGSETTRYTYDSGNSVSLTLDNMPIVQLSINNSEFPTFSYSATQVSGMFSIGNNTTSSSIGSVTSSTSRLTTSESDYPTRYAPYDNASFDWDSSGYLSGSGSGKYPYRSSGSSTSQTGSHSHTTATDDHEHTIDLNFSSSWSLPDDVMLNSSGSSSALEYSVISKSIGIQLITRMF